jgi:hypothetical protein
MYVVKKEHLGAHVTLPTELRKFGVYLTLHSKTHQKVLEWLFKHSHPGVELIEKPVKNDNPK